MEQNKTGKYLKYAIGEILLVVIGIIIAVSIGEWREKKRDLSIENRALISLKAEFEQNLRRLKSTTTRCINVQNSLTDYYELITNPDVTNEEKTEKRMSSLFMQTWSPSNAVLFTLKNTGQIFNIQNDSLKLLLIRWDKELAKQSDREDRLRNDKFKELNDYTQKYVPNNIARKNMYEDFEGYHPNNIEQRLPALRRELINDPQYYGLIADAINACFIYVNSSNNTKEEILSIVRILDQEIADRGLSISTTNSH